MALAAVLVVVVGMALTGLIGTSFQAAGDAAVDELLEQSSDRTTAALVNSATSLSVLIAGMQALYEGREPSRDQLGSFVRRAATGTSAGNALPGAQLVLLIEADPGELPRVRSTETFGLSGDLDDHVVEPDTDLAVALERAAAQPLPTFADTPEFGGFGDRALIAPLRAPEPRARWVAVVIDRQVMLERPLRGTRLGLEAVDLRPGEPPDARDPLEVSDLDQLGVALRADRERTTLVTMADRTFTLTFRPHETFGEQLTTTPVRWLQAAGLTISLLLAWALWVQGSGRARALRRVEQATVALTEREQQFRSLAETSPVGITALDLAGVVTYANRRLVEILAARTEQELCGRPLADCFHDGDRARVRAAIHAATNGGSPEDADVRARLDQAERREVRARFAPVSDGEGGRSGLTGSIEDITAEVLSREQLAREEERHRELAQRFEHEAAHDALTGLPNRSQLIGQLDEVLREAEPGRAAVAFLDLDGFKAVNDTLGHAAGDTLLIEVARRLGDHVRSGDLAARLGGDEFALLLHPVDDPQQVERVAQRTLAAVESPVVIDGRRVQISASIGLAVNTDTRDPQQLLRQADLAMYDAKRRGSGLHRWFSSELVGAAGARHVLAHDLRTALADQALSVAFQPIVDLASGRDVGAEVLARWQDPEHGTVPPAVFLPIAEEAGLLAELGRQVLTQAFQAAAAWPVQLVVAVNASPSQLLAPDHLAGFDRALAAAGIAPDRIQVEVGQPALLAGAIRLVPVLDALRGRGVRIAVDDVGPDPGELSRLRDLPVDTLKIDRSVVAGIEHDPDARTQVQAVLALAREQDLEVIAEGIETAAQHRVLHELGCRLGQGYGLAAPHDPDHQHARAVDQLTRIAGR